MKWLLDTNTLSELMKPLPAAAVVDWLEAHEPECGLSVISIGEMVLGIEAMPESKRRRRLEQTLKYLRQDYADRVLDFSEGVAVEWGRVVAGARKQGRKLSVLDSQIEATALHFGLMVVSRNEADFWNPVFNPWQE